MKFDPPYKRLCIHGEAVIGNTNCYPREILYLNFFKDDNGIWCCKMDDESMERLEKIHFDSPNIVIKTFGDYDEKGNKISTNRNAYEASSFVTKALRDVERLRTMSTVEMMCENLNVKHHVEEWEKRCLKAEKDVKTLKEEVEKWKHNI